MNRLGHINLGGYVSAKSLVHEAEERIKVNLIVLAAIDYSVDNTLEVIEDLNVRDIVLRHCLSI